MVNNKMILQSLQRKKNVLLMGAPGTGKSKLMNDVANIFECGLVASGTPELVHTAPIPIPITPEVGEIGDIEFLSKSNRKVFRTTLHQNSKYRDFITGIAPNVFGNAGYGIAEGILYRANEFAKQEDSAVLLIIDELNRGPAVEVFGGSIVALESDKRLGSNNEVLPTSQFFEIVSPVDGKMVEYAFSPNLYIMSAMNQADVSVAPLDVAFLRRWQSFKLYPDYECLYRIFGVDKNEPIKEICTTALDVYTVAIAALKVINQRITIGRGEDYQIGQGVMLSTKPSGDSLEDALEFVYAIWSTIYTHIEELFFGDGNSIAYVINANSMKSPYILEETTFAGEMKTLLSHKEITPTNVYDLYYAIAENI